MTWTDQTIDMGPNELARQLNYTAPNYNKYEQICN